MPYKILPIDELKVNKSNDRHGSLDSEDMAISWLFSHRLEHMKKLAKDIVEKRTIYEPPLVHKLRGKFQVFDGNRRVTCLKLLKNHQRAPTEELQKYFKTLADRDDFEPISQIECRIEDDIEVIDEILARRHTGSQGGIGQSNWDDRAKENFRERTGRKKGLNVAAKIEAELDKAGMLNSLPQGSKIPRSVLNRLLSSEEFRNRAGFSVSKGEFNYISDKDACLSALLHICHDLCTKKVVLNDVWDNPTKRDYLDDLDQSRILPSVKGFLPGISSPNPSNTKPGINRSRPKPARHKPKDNNVLMQSVNYDINWSSKTLRHKEIWEELQYDLLLDKHPNSISILLRVLIEISIHHYAECFSIDGYRADDKLINRFLKVAEHMLSNSLIKKDQFGDLRKLNSGSEIFSVKTMNQYVHSKHFFPSPRDLKALWNGLADFLVIYLNAGSKENSIDTTLAQSTTVS